MGSHSPRLSGHLYLHKTQSLVQIKRGIVCTNTQAQVWEAVCRCFLEQVPKGYRPNATTSVFLRNCDGEFRCEFVDEPVSRPFLRKQTKPSGTKRLTTPVFGDDSDIAETSPSPDIAYQSVISQHICCRGLVKIRSPISSLVEHMPKKSNIL